MTAAPETTVLTYRHADGVLSRRVGDSMLILVRSSGALICINGSAKALWDSLRNPLSIHGAAGVLADLYSASHDVVEQDIGPVLADLVDRGVLRQSAEPS